MLHIDLLDESTQFTTYATCQVSVAADDDAVEARDQRSLSVPAAAASISGHRFLDEFYADLESLSLFSSSDATIQAAYVYAFVHYFPDAVDQFGSESSGSDTGMFALAQSLLHRVRQAALEALLQMIRCNTNTPLHFPGVLRALFSNIPYRSNRVRRYFDNQCLFSAHSRSTVLVSDGVFTCLSRSSHPSRFFSDVES